jgi:addiction module HigA family antidote
MRRRGTKACAFRPALFRTHRLAIEPNAVRTKPVTTHDYTNFSEPLAHPGQHLREDFLPEYGLSAGALAKAMGLKDRTRIERLIREKQPITPDTALRLSRVFATTPEFWMNLQAQHDLSVAAIASREELAAIKAVGAA